MPTFGFITTESERDNAYKDAIESFAKICYPYRQNNTKAKKLLDLLECGLVFWADKYVKKHNKDSAQKITRATFIPSKVLKAVDNSDQGGFNISGAACYRSIQSLKKYQRGFLFSKSLIYRAARDLEKEAKSINDYKLIKEENKGERVEYTDFGTFVVETIKAYSLE